MNQEQIGRFMKKLRTEKQLTQAELAEEFNVSNRTISRWETGSNLPDISLLLEIADFYEVELRELLQGERKVESMDQEMKETAKEVEKYTENKYGGHILIVHVFFIVALIGLLINVWLVENQFYHSSTLEFIAGLGSGVAFGVVIMGVIITSPYAKKLRKKFI